MNLPSDTSITQVPIPFTIQSKLHWTPFTVHSSRLEHKVDMKAALFIELLGRSVPSYQDLFTNIIIVQYFLCSEVMANLIPTDDL